MTVSRFTPPFQARGLEPVEGQALMVGEPLALCRLLALYGPCERATRRGGTGAVIDDHVFPTAIAKACIDSHFEF
jgi:hypothetical protein